MKKKINFSTLVKIFVYLKYLPKIILKIKNWPVFILNYVGLKDGKFECIFRDGVRISMQDNIGAATIAVIFIKKDYGEVDDNSLIIDIGANIGVYSIFSARNKNNRVYAFEPMPDNYEVMKKNISLNKMENKIFPFMMAVSGKKEKRRLFLGGSPFHSLYSVEESPFNALYGSGDEIKQNYQEVNCLPLNDIFAENKIEKCDMLKMDCEGAEFEILYNLSDENFKKIRKIRMEYHNHKTNSKYTGQALVNFLESKGFAIEKFRKSSFFQGDLWAEKA